MNVCVNEYKPHAFQTLVDSVVPCFGLQASDVNLGAGRCRRVKALASNPKVARVVGSILTQWIPLPPLLQGHWSEDAIEGGLHVVLHEVH